MKARVVFSSKSHEKNLRDSLALLTRRQVLVGIPSTTEQERKDQIMKMLSLARGKNKKSRLKAAAKLVINNAELVYIHTNGSSLRHIPARPIIEPAIEDQENQTKLIAELELVAKAALDGKREKAERQMELVALLAENIVKAWFVNPKNHWAPNAPSTIRQKGSSRPLINTAALRQAMRGLVADAE